MSTACALTVGLALAGVAAACSSGSSKAGFYSVCQSNSDCSSNLCVQKFPSQPALCTQQCPGAGSQLTDCPLNGNMSAHCVVVTYKPSYWVCWP